MQVLNARTVGRTAPNAVYVGRPSPFGNPFVSGRDGTRDDVIAKFEHWIRARPELVERVKAELKGKSLICWCAPRRCHADVLLRIANE